MPQGQPGEAHSGGAQGCTDAVSTTPLYHSAVPFSSETKLHPRLRHHPVSPPQPVMISSSHFHNPQLLNQAWAVALQPQRSPSYVPVSSPAPGPSTAARLAGHSVTGLCPQEGVKLQPLAAIEATPATCVRPQRPSEVWTCLSLANGQQDETQPVASGEMCGLATSSSLNTLPSEPEQAHEGQAAPQKAEQNAPHMHRPWFCFQIHILLASITVSQAHLCPLPPQHTIPASYRAKRKG